MYMVNLIKDRMHFTHVLTRIGANGVRAPMSKQLDQDRPV